MRAGPCAGPPWEGPHFGNSPSSEGDRCKTALKADCSAGSRSPHVRLPLPFQGTDILGQVWREGQRWSREGRTRCLSSCIKLCVSFIGMGCQGCGGTQHSHSNFHTSSGGSCPPLHSQQQREGSQMKSPARSGEAASWLMWPPSSRWYSLR